MKSDTMAPPLTIGIQTFSDTVCPWSYIGKKNLDNAIEKYKEKHPDVEFKETWNPFYLNPEAKTSGEAPPPQHPPPSTVTIITIITKTVEEEKHL
jgi:predicted DsbA family dithiol-disulfide isomerase